MDREKLLQQVKLMRGVHEKLVGQLDTIEAMLLESATPGQIAKGLVGTFIVEWGKRYKGQTYVVSNWPKVLGAFKRLLKDLDATDLQNRIARYVASEDRFYVGAKHSLDLFFQAVNKFGAAAEADLLDGKYAGTEEVDEPPF